MIHLFHIKKKCIVLRTLNKGEIGEIEAKMLGWYCPICKKVVGENYIILPDTEIKKRYPKLEWKKEN